MSPLEHQDLVFLFFAYTALFAAMFVFLVRMFKKMDSLKQELDLLKDEFQPEDETERPSAGSEGMNA